MKLAAIAGAILGFSALLIATIALSQSGNGGTSASVAAPSTTGAIAETHEPAHVAVELGDIFINPGQLTAAAGAVVLDVHGVLHGPRSPRRRHGGIAGGG